MSLVNNERLNAIMNKIIIHPSFIETLKELSKLKIKLPDYGLKENLDFSLSQFPQGGNLIKNIEEIKPYNLNARKGEENVNSKYLILAYDESIQNYNALEGTAYFFSHTIVIHGKKEFIPSIFMKFYFFTKSEPLIKNSSLVIKSDNPSVDYKKKYAGDRTRFIINSVPENSIIFIDGPLIGGQISHYSIKMNEQLLKRNVIPIFIVKNSTSNLVTDYIPELRGLFNSDLHWCYHLLKPGQRTCYFSYIDRNSIQKGKIFCYLKAFDVSPQRIEVHIDTYKKYQNHMDEIMNMIYYLMLVQGNRQNPQIRSIAIAEKFARESLKLFNIKSLIRKIGLTATINESRFGGN